MSIYVWFTTGRVREALNWSSLHLRLIPATSLMQRLHSVKCFEASRADNTILIALRNVWRCHQVPYNCDNDPYTEDCRNQLCLHLGSRTVHTEIFTGYMPIWCGLDKLRMWFYGVSSACHPLASYPENFFNFWNGNRNLDLKLAAVYLGTKATPHNAP